MPDPNTDFVAVAGGFFYSLGLKADGSIAAWGENDLGQCNVPVPNTDFVAVAAGCAHSLGLKVDGSIVAWGRNISGECNVPAPNMDFVAVAGGCSHSLGLRDTCGNGLVDTGEECDDGGESATCDADCTFVECGDGMLNVTAGEECEPAGSDCCDASCDSEPGGTLCGEGPTDCSDQDTCDGAGNCNVNHLPPGTTCGDPSDTACDDPDTCDGTGTCLPNHTPPGESCDDGDVCNGVEACDGIGNCVSQPVADCNENGVEDSCDIEDETSEDCQPNGIPDECEIDENSPAPGGPFFCDPAAPPAGLDECDPDRNNNGIPDKCEPPIGACCFWDKDHKYLWCILLTEQGCETPPFNGIFQGAGTDCPPENVEPAVHGGYMVRHVTNPAIDCLLGVPPKRADCIPGDPIDPWQSPPDGVTCHQFGLDPADCPPEQPDCSPPIPGDFFGPGSDPFDGQVCLTGEPLGPTVYGEFAYADTLIWRAGDPFDRCSLPSTNEVTVEIEIVALNLKSVEPITVTFGINPPDLCDGVPDPEQCVADWCEANPGECEQWNVAVELSVITPEPGMITAVKTHCNGGTYGSEVHVHPKFTLTKVDDPEEVLVLDAGLEGIPYVALVQDDDSVWISDVSATFGLPSEICTDFHPGIEDPEPMTECDCNDNLRRDKCDIEDCPPGNLSCQDCQPNAVPDECDIRDGTSQDCNGNTVPDECETGLLPLITQHPITQTVCEGEAVTFTVMADSWESPQYQWRKDGMDIPGATSDTLSIDPSGLDDPGDYDVVITNACGSITSDVATLTVIPISDPLAEPDAEAGYEKIHYISMVPGNPGRQTALRVTLTNLPGFSQFNDTKMWVGEPQQVSENSGKIAHEPGWPDSMSANLQCTPYCMDWADVGLLHVTDDEIVPGAIYNVQAIDCACDFGNDADYSAPLTITTSKWGDLVGTCAVIPCTPPEGIVNMATDVTACFDKFRNLVGAVLKSRADVEPNFPDGLVNISDCTFELDAFRGFAYPPAQTPPATGWPGPDGCP